MNKDQVEGRWEQIKGRAKRAWGELTDDDFMLAEGSMDKLYGIIKSKAGDSEEAIKAKLEATEELAKAKAHSTEEVIKTKTHAAKEAVKAKLDETHAE